MHGLPLTADNTKGLKTLVYTVAAQVTLLYQACLWAVEDSSIRAGLHTRLAAVTLIFC